MSTKPDAEGGPGEDAADEANEEIDLSSASIADLAREGDADTLFLLAKAARTGTHGRAKDLACAFAAYRAAGELGHPDADYAAALFHLNGTATPRDLKEGAAVLRRAADRGSVDAKITLGNLYELGVHFARDAEKADVWYRNAARAAGLPAPGAPETSRELALLGAVRHAEALATDPTATDEERERAQRRARAHGAGLRDREPSAPGGPPSVAERETREPDKAARRPATSPAAQETPAVVPVDPEAARRAKLTELAAKAKAPSRLTAKAGAGAFLYALLFTATAFGAAFAADAGARELVTHGQRVPLFGRPDLVFPGVLGVVAVLPQLLVYRASSVARAVALGGLAFGLGWVLHNTGKLALVDAKLSQAMAFAGAGLLAALLAQGLLGGAKRDRDDRVDRPERRLR
ncbi:MAG: hypothetical protein IPF92_24540 [Myxococcales bacterium]|nr:hypothetical protein [Myxococcales bacterium]